MFQIHFARRAMPAVGVLVFLAACGGGDGPTQPPAPAAVTVAAGNNLADSVGATPVQPLVVEVRQTGGTPAAGVQVQFESSTANAAAGVASAGLAASAGGDFQPTLTVVTDNSGRAAATLRLGTQVGGGTVTIRVPALSLETVAPFTVQPGAPVQLFVQPRDSAVYVGGSYTLRITTRDRWGNTAGASGTTVVSDSPYVSVSGATVSGGSYGRAQLRVTAGKLSATADVSVVPRGTLLAHGVTSGSIYVFGLDGSGFRRVITDPGARLPRWFPDGQTFVYNVGTGHAYISDLNGVKRPLLADPGALTGELWPHPSRDGQWVYFGGYKDLYGAVYRVKSDGTGAELVPGVPPDASNTQAHPTTSPTGDRVTYFRYDPHDSPGPLTLRVVNIQTGTLVAPGVQGHAPEWSHGESIAYIGPDAYGMLNLRVMASDGSGSRVVSDGPPLEPGIDWSPDDRWIVASDLMLFKLVLIEVSTGRRIPLPFTNGLGDPAWH